MDDVTLLCLSVPPTAETPSLAALQFVCAMAMRGGRV